MIMSILNAYELTPHDAAKVTDLMFNAARLEKTSVTDSTIEDAWVLVTTPTRIEGNHVATHYALPTKNGQFQIWQQGLFARWQYRYVQASTGPVFYGVDEGYDTLEDAKQAVRTVKEGFGIQQGG